MKKSKTPHYVQVRDVPGKGRGVFALKDFRKGEILEQCHVLIFNRTETQQILETMLEHYAFDWQGGKSALVLGNGMIYNHSYTPNAKLQHDFAGKYSEIVAVAPIKQGAEILINYNGEGQGSDSPLWFDVVDRRK